MESTSKFYKSSRSIWLKLKNTKQSVGCFTMSMWRLMLRDWRYFSDKSDH